MIGIDVSHWQGAIDWQAAKTAIYYAILKCTQGIWQLDDQYTANKKGCDDNNIPFGVYHFLEPNVDGTKQAEYFYNHADPTLLFWAIDVEWGGDQLAVNLEKCVKRLEELTGEQPYIYTNAGVWKTYFPVMPEWAEPCPLWVANPTTADTPCMPAGFDAWEFWQFSWEGQIPGIAGNVDLNRFNGEEWEIPLVFGNGDEITPQPIVERVRVTNPYGLYIRSAPVITPSTVLGGANYGSTWTVMSRVKDALNREWVQIAPMAYIAGWYTVRV